MTGPRAMSNNASDWVEEAHMLVGRLNEATHEAAWAPDRMAMLLALAEVRVIGADIRHALTNAKLNIPMRKKPKGEGDEKTDTLDHHRPR